jgi:hypothetical protein
MAGYTGGVLRGSQTTGATDVTSAEGALLRAVEAATLRTLQPAATVRKQPGGAWRGAAAPRACGG